MSSFIALCICLAVLVFLTAAFAAFLKNARALRRELDDRFSKIQDRLEKEANALVKELLARSNGKTN